MKNKIIQYYENNLSKLRRNEDYCSIIVKNRHLNEPDKSSLHLVINERKM